MAAKTRSLAVATEMTALRRVANAARAFRDACRAYDEACMAEDQGEHPEPTSDYFGTEMDKARDDLFEALSAEQQRQ